MALSRPGIAPIEVDRNISVGAVRECLPVGLDNAMSAGVAGYIPTIDLLDLAAGAKSEIQYIEGLSEICKPCAYIEAAVMSSNLFCIAPSKGVEAIDADYASFMLPRIGTLEAIDFTSRSFEMRPQQYVRFNRNFLWVVLSPNYSYASGMWDIMVEADGYDKMGLPWPEDFNERVEKVIRFSWIAEDQRRRAIVRRRKSK